MTARYEFTDLPPGDYTVKASRRGYLDAEYGQTRAFEHGAEIKLSVGQKRERADISLPRQGAVAGHVVDENGDPVEGARVSVFQIRFTAGRQQLIEALAAKKWTDDRGSFRVHDLQPGQYLVRASFARFVGSLAAEAGHPGLRADIFSGDADAGRTRVWSPSGSHRT